MGEYPVKRNLDNIYFRTCRDGKWISICWSDMTPEERNGVGERSAGWWKDLAEQLGDCLHKIGDQFEISLTVLD